MANAGCDKTSSGSKFKTPKFKSLKNFGNLSSILPDNFLCSKGLCFSPQVILLIAQSEAFEFVLADGGDVSVVNAQKLILGSHVSASALFPIRPVALGMMEISVDAVSAEASDSLVWRVLVKVWYDGNTGKSL